MSADGTQIVCRKCKETIDTEGGACPHCGTGIRNTIPYLVGVLFGLVLMGTAVLGPEGLLFYGLVGFLVAAGCGFMVYEKRQRVQRASERGS